MPGGHKETLRERRIKAERAMNRRSLARLRKKEGLPVMPPSGLETIREESEREQSSLSDAAHRKAEKRKAESVEQEAKRQKAIVQRKKETRQIMQLTPKGQPRMKNTISRLLSKIVASSTPSA